MQYGGSKYKIDLILLKLGTREIFEVADYERKLSFQQWKFWMQYGASKYKIDLILLKLGTREIFEVSDYGDVLMS